MSRETMLQAIEEAVGGPVQWKGGGRSGPLSSSSLAETADGRLLFVKMAERGAADQLTTEARGLAVIGAPLAIRVPDVVAVQSEFLALEYIATGTPASDFPEAFGRSLARLHRTTSDAFGLDFDNYCGLTPQPNAWKGTWVEFFREKRLQFQQKLLNQKGRADHRLNQALDRVCDRLEEWILLDEPPALIHGDLWSGNFLVGEDGHAVLIDPAPYYGSREADLAMTELFGGFPRGFYQGYRDEWPLLPGYSERRDLYNLYHVLNHANLFGGGYISQAAQIAHHYGG